MASQEADWSKLFGVNSNSFQIMYPGCVISSEDPDMLGRLRVRPLSEKYADIVNAVPNWSEETDPWTSRDPLIFLPLLPYYLNINPEVGEYVNIIYQNPNYPKENKYYISGVLSTPMAVEFEACSASQKNLASGNQFKSTKSLKNQNGTYQNEKSKGIFPEPKDNAIVGRGSTDIILKKDEVLLRAGKVKRLSLKNLPTENPNRAFLQLSRFNQKKIELPSDIRGRLTSEVKVVKKVIIWNILNLDNKQGVFTGNVGLYNVKPSINVNTTNFTVESMSTLSKGVDYSGPLESVSFMGTSYIDTIKIINEFVRGVINEFKDYKGKINNIKNVSLDGLFPLVVAPSKQTYENGIKIKSNQNSDNPNDVNVGQLKDDATIFANYNKFFYGISPTLISGKRGFFTIYGMANGNPILITPTIPKFEIVRMFKFSPGEDVTYATVGAQRLFLLSHDSDGPKGKISLANTLYGISQDDFVGKSVKDKGIIDKTYPMVRGDKLMELLEKIVDFMAGHVHAISTLPPIPISSGSGQSIEEIYQLLADAENQVLNQNIRLN
jgi:hypothetical protein